MLILKRAILFISGLLLVGSIYGQQPKLIVPIGHTDDILSIEFSPDSKYIVTTSQDKTANVWETASGRLLFSMRGQNVPFTNVKFSHNGKLLLTVSDEDSTVQRGISSSSTPITIVKIWDAFTGNLNKLLRLEVRAQKIDFSKDDKKLLVQSGEGLSVYDTAALHSVFNLQSAVVTISPNEKFIVTIPPYYNNESGIATILGASTGSVFKRGNSFHTFKLEEHANHISFSSNDKYILVEYLIDLIDSVIVYEAASGKLLYRLASFNDWEIPAVFSPRGNYILTVHGAVKIWSASNGVFLDSLKGENKFRSASFSSDEKYIVTEDDSTGVKIWNALTGNLVHVVQDKNQSYYSHQDIRFTSDNKYVIASNKDYMKTKIWEASTSTLIYNSDEDNVNTNLRQRREFVPVCVSSSPDGRYIAVAKYDKAKVWDTRSGNFMGLQAVAKAPRTSLFSPDGKYIATIYLDSTANIWEVSSGKVLYSIKENLVTSIVFSIDGKIATISGRNSDSAMVKIWNVADGKLLYAMKGQGVLNSVNFSFDGREIITAEYQKIKIWQAETGELAKEIPTPAVRLSGQLAGMSPDGSSIVTSDGTAWDASTGKELRRIPGDTNFNIHGFHSQQYWDFFPGANACFSPDGKYLAAIHAHSSYQGSMEGVGIVNLSTGDVNYLSDELYRWDKAYALDVKYSLDGKHISVVCTDGTVKTWDILTGKQNNLYLNHSYIDASFSPDLKYIVTASTDHTTKIIETANGRLLYTFITMDSMDYLVTDAAGRYDGTEAARKVLYYVCGSEIIELEQLKELLWEPNLVGKIMGSDPYPISSKKLQDIDICGYTPLVEQHGLKDNRYDFTITSRRGGLGEISLYVGGKQIKVYQPASLKRNGNNYQLIVNQKDIADYLVTGEENTITVKATTENNQLSSKGQKVSASEKGDSVLVIPNFYCISVGICKYKGDSLNLMYASQDAADFEQAVSASSRRLLNTDGKEHVISYIFNTEPASPDHWPLKDNIRKAFEDIAKKATANDILLVFLSGHGVLSNRQFYYLTQQASAFELAGAEKEVAISSEELNEWMRKIKAQKQVLILDACNSGQALQSLVIRKDLPPDQQRALEKLKDMTGTYLLSASASNQSAFEMGMYGRGLLTYSLLLGMKTGEGLKEKYVDIAKWFQFAAEKAKELAKDVSNRQDPQISLNGTFPIGIVYKELLDQIKLATKKPQFKRSNFQNDDLFIDNLKIGQAIDKELNELTFTGKNRPLVFFADAIGDSVYSINGRYKTSENHIKGEVRLFEGEKSIFSMTIDTTIGNVNAMVKEVVEKMIKEVK
jgi:WD40 repeat protein